MIAQILVAGILILTYLIYKLWLKPTRLMKHYGQLFRKNGYRVKVEPLKVHTAPIYEGVMTNWEKHNDSMHDFKKTYIGNDILISNVLTTPQIVFLNFDLIKEIISAQKISILLKVPTGYEALLLAFEKGIAFIQKDQWKNRRKILSKIFNFDFITSNIQMMIRSADQIFEKYESSYWKLNESKQSRELQVELYDLLTHFTSNVVMAGFFGFDILKEQLRGKSLAETILDFEQRAAQLSKDPFILAFGMKFLKRGLRKKDRELLQLNKQIQQVIQSHIDSIKDMIDRDGEKANRQSIVSSLLFQRKKTQNGQDFDISDASIVGEVKTFMIAGSETTSNFLTMMILYVFEKPEVEERLRAQIDSAIKSDKDITVENFKKLTYLDCIIYQTSRMFSSAIGLFERTPDQDTSIGGVPIKKGTSLAVNWVTLFYDSATFKNPFEFIPERWEKENKEQIQLASMIFSGGPRSCIGKNLALTEMRVMMIKFMQRYSKLVEVQKDQRSFKQQLVLHLAKSKVILTRKGKEGMKTQ